MKKLRWAMDGGFWDLDMSTPRTLDGVAKTVPGDSLPLSLTRGVRLSRPKQLDFMHRFMSIPLVPSYAGDPNSGGDGFTLQRVLAFSIGENWFATILGQFHLQKFLSALNVNASSHPEAKYQLKHIWKHLRDKSLYALGFCSEFLITPDRSLLINSEIYGDNKGHRSKVVYHHRLPEHNFLLEATWPGLFVDKFGTYWDVPLSMAFDFSPTASDSGLSYHLSMHNNSGHPKVFGDGHTRWMPRTLLPGYCVKAAFSLRKNAEIWKGKGENLKMVLPFDIFLSHSRMAASGIIGTVLSAFFGDNSTKPPVEDELRAFSLRARGNKSVFVADLFASVSCRTQYGNFQRLFFDLTRLDARVDFSSAVKFFTGVADLAQGFYNSQQVDTEAVRAVCPEVTLSFQQQIVGPFSFRVDSRIAFDSDNRNYLARVDENVFAIEYALKVLVSAKAVAWYSSKYREAMIELRFFES